MEVRPTAVGCMEFENSMKGKQTTSLKQQLLTILRCCCLLSVCEGWVCYSFLKMGVSGSYGS